ncbi:MAG: hypothetical protein DWB99_07795 [Candidatus Poseidoniales archaeon]|nr:MAG: hypothetical protein DWB99_07795 [Candidatus Poseidoniales archaeon]
MRSRFVLIVLFILLAPLIAISPDSSLSISKNASAADACKGDLEPVKWNQTLQRIAMVPHFNPYDDWWGFWDEGDGRKGNNKDSGNGDSAEQESTVDMSLSPEPSWMYDLYEHNLESFDSNHHSTLLIGNDSVGALKLNLSANHRTTVCITLQNLNQTSNSDVSADVYLMTSSEYDKYEESYFSSHSGNNWYSEAEESLSDIPPEWRSFNFLGWKTYRDAHQYEKVDSVNFALSLDGPEVYSGLFGDADWQDFYIVIDTWDNVHDNDELPPDAIIAADVTIITTERTLILPNFTVSLVFLALIILLAISPFIINARYMRAGLDTEQTSTGFVPSLNMEPELPPVVRDLEQVANTPTALNSHDIGQLDDENKQIPNLPEE